MLKKYDTAVDMFMADCRMNDLAVTTQENYSRVYRMYRDFMEANGYEEASVEATVNWKLSLTTSIVSTSLYLQYIKYLSDFAVASGVYDKPFMSDKLMPSRKKVSAAKAKPYEHLLTAHQMKRIINAEQPTYGRKPHTWPREHAEVVLLLMSGMRNVELRNLALSDLDFEQGIIHARITKGNKPRIVPFPAVAQNAVRAYLASDIRPKTVSPDDYLFGTTDRVTGEWHGMERGQLSKQILSHTSCILGDESGVRSHALRHGFASSAISLGVSIDQIGEALGHSNTQTTRIYAERLNPAETLSDIGNILSRAYT